MRSYLEFEVIAPLPQWSQAYMNQAYTIYSQVDPLYTHWLAPIKSYWNYLKCILKLVGPDCALVSLIGPNLQQILCWTSLISLEWHLPDNTILSIV